MEGKMNLQDTFLNEARKEKRAGQHLPDEWCPAQGQSEVLRQLYRTFGQRKPLPADLQARYIYNSEDLNDNNG